MKNQAKSVKPTSTAPATPTASDIQRTFEVAAQIYAHGCLRSPERRETFARSCIESARAFVETAKAMGIA